MSYFTLSCYSLVTCSRDIVTSVQCEGPGMSGISAVMVSSQCPGPGNVCSPGRCLLSAIVFTHSSVKVSQLSPYITSSQGPVWPFIGQFLNIQASDWLAVAQLPPCLTSACQRDRPQSVNVFRHNLNEHLGPDTNLENYWIYIPNTF